MKKVFISCPMKGRTTENIVKTMDKMLKCAEAALGEELNMIISVATNPPSVDDRGDRIWHLGESIKMLSMADLFVTLSVPYYFEPSGCDVEEKVAMGYGIEMLRIGGDCFKYFCPDLAEQYDRSNSMYNTPTCSPSEANDE